MRKVLVIYYSQSGQLKDIADSITKPLFKNKEINVDYYKIKPIKDFPFPWPADEFFDVMPESVKGYPIQLDLSDFPVDKKYDLVIFAYQVWFLSPAIPAWSFLSTDIGRDFLKDKKVLTLLGVRNMWMCAHERVKKILEECNADYVGNIVLIDKTNNLVSVATIIKWLMKGNKGPYRFLPEAGVTQYDIQNAERFAEPIKEALIHNKFKGLQDKLLKLDAVVAPYHIIKIEKTASRIFGVFADFILKKGKAGDKKRILRVRIFKYYLLFAIYVLFPIASLIFMIRKLLHRKSAEQVSDYYKKIN